MGLKSFQSKESNPLLSTYLPDSHCEAHCLAFLSVPRALAHLFNGLFLPSQVNCNLSLLVSTKCKQMYILSSKWWSQMPLMVCRVGEQVEKEKGKDQQSSRKSSSKPPALAMKGEASLWAEHILISPLPSLTVVFHGSSVPNVLNTLGCLEVRSSRESLGPGQPFAHP